MNEFLTDDSKMIRGVTFAPEQLTTRIDPLLVDPAGSTDLLEGDDQYVRPKRLVHALMGAVILAFRPIAEPESSRTINPFWISIARRLGEEEEIGLATFLEPIDFAWDSEIDFVRNMAREYSKQTYADY